MSQIFYLHRFCALLGLFSAIFLQPRGLAAEKPLLLPEVLSSVQTRYPPLLAILIEQDIANGRARQALGAFDLALTSGADFKPSGYYDGRTGSILLNQPLEMGGANVYGGYRLSSGFLPNYNKDRTGVDGEAVLGFKLPLLRDSGIDPRRARLYQARIDQELADPIILRQYLDFTRAATITYYNWLAAGQRLSIAESLLRIAKDRDTAIAEQVLNGATAPIVQIDNRRLVVNRQIAVVQAIRRFEAMAIELSLFHRSAKDDQPILSPRSRLPDAFPQMKEPDAKQLNPDIAKAMVLRPELRRIELTLDKADVDRRLAKNNLLPNLDVGVEANLGQGAKDIDPTEVTAKLELKVPLQRNEAKGQLVAVEAQIDRLENDRKFAKDRISADVRDAYSALTATFEQLKQTRLNVDLSQQIETAENERLKQGATDLLALQIREQATFDAKVLDLEAQAEFFRSQANYRAAVAADAPASLLK